MFDPTFYRFQHPDIANLPLEELHTFFNEKGWREGHDPSATFNVADYLHNNPDVAEADANPLEHYLQYGREEGRQVTLSNWGQAQDASLSLAELEASATWIDPDYLRHTVPMIAEMDDATIAAWYIVLGWRDGVDPSDRFEVGYYLETYEDVAHDDVNPLLHFIHRGQAEGRFPTKAEKQAKLESAEEQNRLALEEQNRLALEEQNRLALEEQNRLALDMDVVRNHFNAEWYAATYPDVEGDADDLLRSFMTVGWREGRDPSPQFSTTYYLSKYDDIAQSNSNPILHYVLFGEKERRKCIPGQQTRLGYSPQASIVQGLPLVITRDKLLPTSRPPKSVQLDKLDIHWLVPDFTPGSGGHMTIFRMIRYMELFGHRNTIWIENPSVHDTEGEAWETIVKSFQCVEAKVRFMSDEFFEISADVAIATGWSTAWAVNELKGAAARMYFVQDHEPEFYPTGSNSTLAKLSYSFDMGCICASPWLETLMANTYGRWAKGFYLGYEPEQYFVKPQSQTPQTSKTKIAVYGRSHTDRRCVQLALAALEILAQSRDDFEVHFFGQEDPGFSEAPFEAYNHGVMSPHGLNNLYNDCDIGICFSGTNYSLVPQEMMACGLPVVEFNTQSTQAIFPDGVVTLAGPMPTGIAEQLGQLIDAPEMREKQRQAALDWVQSFGWRDSAVVVESAIKEYLKDKGVTLSAPAVSTSKEILFDVVVPTYNGIAEFKPVLDALRGQALAGQTQIHCIDSSSSDGTGEWLREQKDISLTIIDQKDFQHGRTRNDGAALGKAPFIGFITQDAQPATHHWATDILKMMRAVPQAAGLFGRHIAYPDHPIFVREEITNHFQNMMDKPLVLSKHTDPERWESGDIGWRQFLHFYSDNNSAMRRDVWNDIPYPEIDYGEDQVWARAIIEAGHAKIYAPTATVFHSHDYNPEQTYKRSKTEGAFFYEHFGYELGKGTPEQIVNRTAREQRNMESWGLSRGISAAEIEMRKANIVEKYRGWRDGRAEV